MCGVSGIGHWWVLATTSAPLGVLGAPGRFLGDDAERCWGLLYPPGERGGVRVRRQPQVDEGPELPCTQDTVGGPGASVRGTQG